MRSAARVAAAIDVLARWQAGDAGLDRILTTWGRENRYAGAKDRRAIADLAYDALRRWRSAAWVAGLAEAPRAALIGTCRLDGPPPETIFTGERHAPASLAPEERDFRSLDDAPRMVRLDLPDWLTAELDGVSDEALLRLRERAPVDLRVNLLKGGLGQARERLAAEGVEAAPGPLSPTCLRVAGASRPISTSHAYADGLVELQDAASQAVADHAAARPGEAVLDFCAGGGGKTLALAAAMRGTGRLVAHDIAPARLRQLRPRAERAGVQVELMPPGGFTAMAAQTDLTFVDAPCSGSGAWRRNPDAKWRLHPGRLDELVELQQRILQQAATTVRPGGRLVYSTCSLLPRENGAQIRRFLAAHPDFEAAGPPLVLTPLDGGDGFFSARLKRRG